MRDAPREQGDGDRQDAVERETGKRQEIAVEKCEKKKPPGHGEQQAVEHHLPDGLPGSRHRLTREEGGATAPDEDQSELGARRSAEDIVHRRVSGGWPPSWSATRTSGLLSSPRPYPDTLMGPFTITYTRDPRRRADTAYRPTR